MKGKKDDDDDSNRRGNQAVQPFNENGLEDVDKKTVKVELRNGVCYVERGDDQSMTAKCNAALQEMSDFQRQFLATVPAGQPNKLLFTEEIRRNSQGDTKTSFYFTNREKETSGILSPLYSLKRKVLG
ncbi:hypothetical protein PoB_001462800 [Plakobranchus ocellatus]|uniref:Uncharacterized protein n=1 Tax=Plakobranchus ocellatus TaxID=259542 RepID=A0AAV3Z0H0_9GAST|nr:hypothetical protein PoB_001462800 [Plakobranchus ocellatus]